MRPVMGVKNFSKLPPEFYSFHIGNLVSRKLPPHYPQTVEADKTHEWYNYWLPYIRSTYDPKPAKYQSLPKHWTKNLSSIGRMAPKFIVTINDLLPPYTVLFPHPRTMSDSLRCAPSLFRHRRNTATHSSLSWECIAVFQASVERVLRSPCATVAPGEPLSTNSPGQLVIMIFWS